jgi:hypothetical protein
VCPVVCVPALSRGYEVRVIVAALNYELFFKNNITIIFTILNFEDHAIQLRPDVGKQGR